MAAAHQPTGFGQRMLIGIVLCVVGVLSIDPPAPTPVFLWNRGVDTYAEVPFAPNVVASSVAQVVVEFRQNRSSHLSGYLRGLNATNGASLWTFTTPCQEVRFIEALGDDASFVVGCTTGFYVHSIVNGGTLAFVQLPPHVQFAPIAEPIATGGYRQYVRLLPKKYLILSLVNMTDVRKIQYGSLVYNVGTRTLTSMATMQTCPTGTPVYQLYTAPGEQGYAQLCAAYQLSYVLFRSNTSVPQWAFFQANATSFKGVMYASGASLSNVAVLYTVSGVQTLAAFDVVQAAETPVWTYTLPSTGGVAPIGTIQQLNVLGSTILLVGQDGVASVNMGVVGWVCTSPATFPYGILPFSYMEPSIFGGVLIVATTTTMVAIDVTNGNISNVVMLDNQVNTPLFVVAAPIRSSETKLNASMPSVSGASWRLVVASETFLQLVDVLHGVLSQDFPIPSGTPNGPLTLLSGVFTSTPLESVLLLQTSTGMTSMSLSFGWTLLDAQYVGQQDAVVFVNTASGNAAALDRNGNALWEHTAPFNAQTGAPFPFVSNLLLDVVGSSAIAAYDTYNGSLITTLLIASDCFDNFTLPSPSLQTIVPDASLQNAYFGASLPCLFRLENTLTLHAIPLPFLLATTPIVDSDNGLAYLFTQYQLFSASIPLGLTIRKLYTTTSKITAVVASSSFSAPANLRKGLNPIVFLFTENGITAIDVLDFGNTYVWNVPMADIQSYAFYNNSLYVVAPTTGICRLSLNVSLSSAQRILWCNYGRMVGSSSVVSNMVFTADGILLVAIDANVWTIDAQTGASRWHLSGTIAIAEESACSQILLDAQLGILFVSCALSVHALDTFRFGQQLFFVNFLTNMQLYYFSGTLFAGQAHQSVSGFQVPTMFLARGLPPPSPAATVPPAPETVPPGFIPLPEVPAPIAPYPQPQNGYPEAPTVKSVQVGQQVISSGSSVTNNLLFPDLTFLTPHADTDTGACVIAQFDAVTLRPNWVMPVGIPACACTQSLSRVVGSVNVVGSGVFVYTCGAALYVHDGATGVALWNTSQSAHAFDAINYWGNEALPWATGGVVVGVEANSITGFAAATGVPLFTVPLNITNPVATQTYFPSGDTTVGYLTIVGQGVQVVRMGPNTTQAQTTAVVLPGNGPTDQDKLCAANLNVQFAIPAEPSSETNEYKNMSVAYFACFHNVQYHAVAVFQVQLELGTVSPLANISVGASTKLNSLMVERLNGVGSVVNLFVNMDRLLYLVSVNTTAKIVWVVGGSFYPTMGLMGSLLLVASSADAGRHTGKMPVLAFDAPSGATLWNVSCTAPYAFLEGQERFGINVLSNGLFLLGAVGIYAINTTSATIVWASQTSNQGMVRRLAAYKNAPFTAPADASNTLVSVVVATYYSTSQSMLVVSLVPAAPELAPRYFQASLWDAYPTEPSGVMGFVAVDPMYTQLRSLSPSAATGWAYAVDNPAGVFTRTIFAGGIWVPVTFLFQAYHITLYHTNSGQLLSKYFRSDACSVAAGNPLTTPVMFDVIGPYAIFSDEWCVYRIDPAHRAMTAVVLSPLGTLSVTPFTLPLITSDNSTILLNSQAGAVYAIDLNAMQLLWANDANQFFLLTGLAAIQLPSYDVGVPLAEQQLLGYNNEGVVSLCVGTGEILWFWSYTRNGVGVTNMVVVSDGTAFVYAGNNFLTKLALQVTQQPGFGRIIWEISVGPLVGPMHQVPHAGIVVVVANGLVKALNVTSGAVVWTNHQTQPIYDCAAIASVPFPDAASNPAPMVVVVTSQNQYAVSTVDGTTQYYFAASTYSAHATVFHGQVAFDLTGDVSYAALPYPTPLRYPSTFVGTPPPTVPPNYHFAMPSGSSSPTVPGLTLPPQPLTTWTFAPALGIERSANSYTVVSDVAGQDVLFTLTTGVGFGVGQVYAMTIVDALKGTQLRPPINFGGGCGATWMGAMSADILAIACSVTASVSLLDISTIQPLHMRNLSNIVPQGGTFVNTLSFTIPDYRLGCIILNDGAGFACIDVNRQHNASVFGSVVFNFTCPNGAVMAQQPMYRPSLQLIVAYCLEMTAGYSTLYAINANDGHAVWQNNFGGGHYIDQLAWSAQNFGAALIDTVPPSGVVTVALFSVATGITQLPMLHPLPATFHSGDVLQMYLLEIAAAPLQTEVLLITGGSVYAFNSATNATTWQGPIGGSPQVGSALVDNPTTGRSILYIVPQTGSLRAFDALNGSVVATWLYQGPTLDTFVGASVVASGVFFAYQASVMYLDAATNDVLYYPLPDNAAVNRVAVVPVYVAATQDLLLDISTTSGTIVQLIANISGAAAFAASEVGVARDGAGAEYIVATKKMATFAYDDTGAMLWGSYCTYAEHQGTHESFDPAVFAMPTGPSVLLKSILPRTFIGFSMNNGSQLYAGYLPLCNGDGASITHGSATSAADADNGVLYVSVNNPCLYAIAAATGAVSVTPVPSKAPLLTAPVVSQHCVLAMDNFGAIMCFSRGPHGPASPTPLWSFSTGYMVDTANILLTIQGNLLLVNVGNTLYCVAEASGVLVWQTVLGPHLVYVVGSNNTVYASSWTGVYAISLDPTAAQRIVWFVSTQQLFGTPYSTGYTVLTAVPPPIQTVNGLILVNYGRSILGLKAANGAKVFITTVPASCSAIVYAAQADPVNRVFVGQCGTVGLYSVATGNLVAVLGPASTLRSTPPIILSGGQAVLFSIGTGSGAQLAPISSYVVNTVPAVPVAPTSAPTPATLPPNYTPQGAFTPLPTLPPGATLPDLSCVLNIEALYGDLVGCVNNALNTSYALDRPDAMYCTGLAERTAPCVAGWISNVIPNCGAGYMYLEQVLTALNHSAAFGFCANPTRCSDGAAGAHAICELVNAATSKAGGQTFAPSMPWPKPANKLPQFTIPANTVGPGTTTTSPVTSPAPSPTGTGASTTTTTTMAPMPTTLAPSTSPAPSPQPTSPIDYMFTCVLPVGQVHPPQNFALLVGLQIGLSGAASISVTLNELAAASGATGLWDKHAIADPPTGGISFWFVFTGVDAVGQSNTLQGIIAQNPTAVAQSLGLQAIAAAPYTPSPKSGGPPSGGLSGGAVAGIVIVILVLVAAVVGLLVRHRMRRDRYAAAAIRGSMIQEDGAATYGAAAGHTDGPISAASELGVKDNSQGPIYSSM